MGVDAQVGDRRLGRERRGESADASGRRAAARGFSVILPSGRLFRGRGRGGRRARVPGTRPLTPLAAVSGRSRRVRCESRRGGGRGSRRDPPGRPHERRGRRGEGRRSPRAAVSPGAATTRGETLRGAVSVVSTSDSSRTPSLTDSDLDAFAESLDGANLVLDSSSAVARSSELAATAAGAAIEETRRRARRRGRAPPRHGGDGVPRHERWARGGRSERGHWVGGAPRALEVAKERAEEAREASAALARVARSRATRKRRRRGRGEGGGDRRAREGTTSAREPRESGGNRGGGREHPKRHRRENDASSGGGDDREECNTGGGRRGAGGDGRGRGILRG